MKKPNCLWCLVFTALVLFNSIHAKEGIAKSNKINLEFTTYTPGSLSEIYSHKWKVKPAKISGSLYLPNSKGKVPVVILYHGSAHPSKLKLWFDDVIPKLLDEKIAAFVLDSYSGRNILNTYKNQTQLSKAARIVDAFSALKKLSSLDMIDKNKIGITGYSFGGIISMVSADKRLVDAKLANGEKFAAHLPVFPSCQGQFRNLQLTGAPMMFLVGELDDYTPAKYCLSYVERMIDEGYDVKIKMYKGVHHAWLTDFGVTNCKKCMTFANCGVVYLEDDGHEVALNGKTSTREGWSQYVDTLFKICGKRGTTIRFDKKARNDTILITVDFFSKSLISNE